MEATKSQPPLNEVRQNGHSTLAELVIVDDKQEE